MAHTEAEQVRADERSVWWQRAALVALAAFGLWLYVPVIRWLVGSWNSNSDYSHGYLVPIFAGYLLWSGRGRLGDGVPSELRTSLGLGGGLLLVSLLLRVAGIFLQIQTFEGLSLIPLGIGIATVIAGRAGLRWSTPAALFLIFMIPLPSFLSGQLSGLLQSIATSVSTFGLQTLGIPAVAEGNIISLSQGQIGVAEACSGIRMLYSFIALTIGACLIIDRTRVEKLVIALSAIPIAVAANSLRIIGTGLAYEFLDPDLASHFFHDVAGWLMMPVGFMLLMLLLAVLDRLIVVEDPAAELGIRNASGRT